MIPQIKTGVWVLYKENHLATDYIGASSSRWLIAPAMSVRSKFEAGEPIQVFDRYGKRENVICTGRHPYAAENYYFWAPLEPDQWEALVREELDLDDDDDIPGYKVAAEDQT